ncbi:hypothetical protein HNQ80_002266 [Anaerosolibacter carboniphilus]|uniref:Uncharacterized protein n=1 Tax=Anaerosolibacter carboniphilus TaxID=1417629 RepID=A0A841KRX2_9FIRM|nr:hypothetical protein [Anaerosolibacter carboniphilus]MBB6216167.1 hypothetical protein [Anaerosolibacter carboniphilus]
MFEKQGVKELYGLAQKLEEVAKAMGELTEQEKKFIIERIDANSPKALLQVYEALHDYMGW